MPGASFSLYVCAQFDRNKRFGEPLNISERGVMDESGSCKVSGRFASALPVFSMIQAT